jgi:N-methylhydantoinase B
MTRLVDVIAPPGSLVNPIHPAPLSARHLAVQRIADLMVEALGQLMPERDVAGAHVSFPAWTFRSFDDRWGKDTILADILGGGTGARQDSDGDHALDTYTSNCAILPAEIAELEYPWRIECTELVDGSQGEGRYRGGMGLRRDITLLADAADGSYYVEQCRAEFAAKGRAGGGPGARAVVRLRRAGETEFTEIPGKGYLRIGRGDTISFTSSAGGGYGAPEA